MGTEKTMCACMEELCPCIEGVEESINSHMDAPPDKLRCLFYVHHAFYFRVHATTRLFLLVKWGIFEHVITCSETEAQHTSPSLPAYVSL